MSIEGWREILCRGLAGGRDAARQTDHQRGMLVVLNEAVSYPTPSAACGLDEGNN